MPPEHSRQVLGNPSSAPPGDASPLSLTVSIDVSGLSHPGNVRPRNEDHFLVTRIGRYIETVLTSLPAGELPERTEEAGYGLIVADGMGGHAGGELASRLAVTGLVKLAFARPDWIFRLDETVVADATQHSRGRFEDLNAMLIEHGRKDPDVCGMGTTLTAARNLGRHLQIVHVGDSRAYLLRQERLHRLTRDHTYVQLLIETGQLSPEDAAGCGISHVLVNALGGSNDDVQVDVDQLELADGDRLLLCSDGLTDLVDDDSIRQVLMECPESAESCRRLVDLALAGGGRDNVTVVVAGYSFSAPGR
jgi:PPM family protein phosphatase